MELVNEALSLSSGIKTRKDIIHKALREYVTRRKRRDLRDIRGQVEFDDDYDYRTMRSR